MRERQFDCCRHVVDACVGLFQDLTARDVTKFAGIANALFECMCEQRDDIYGFATALEGDTS